METRSAEIIQAGTQHIRISPWRAEDRSALITPLNVFERTESEIIESAVSRARELGYVKLFTSALLDNDTPRFVEYGFQLKEQLHILRRNTESPSINYKIRIRSKKPSPTDLDAVVKLDQLCFDSYWTMNKQGLLEAESATSRARFRIAQLKGANGSPEIVGYALTGSGNKKGYLQRLAVHPDFQGHGIGQQLVADGIEWLRFWRVNEMYVNTQIKNENALSFYLKMKFVLLKERLNILEYDVNS